MNDIEDEVMFGAVINQLAAAFGKTAEPALIDAYFMALEDLEFAVVEAACHEALRSCEYFPRPVHLRGLAGAIEQDPGLAASEAWEDMVRIIQGPHGAVVDRRPHQDDEIANEAMRLLGPMPLVSDWDGPWAEKRFTEHYLHLKDRERAERRRLATAPSRRKLGT